jgi:hypothetical protein
MKKIRLVDLACFVNRVLGYDHDQNVQSGFRVYYEPF